MYDRIEKIVSYFSKNFSNQATEDELTFFLFAVDVIFSHLRFNMTGLEYFAEPERVMMYESSIEMLADSVKSIGPRGVRWFSLKRNIQDEGFYHREKMYMDWVIKMMLKGAGFESFKTWGEVGIEIVFTDQLSIDFIQSLDLFEAMGE